MRPALLPFAPNAFRRFNRGAADLWWGWCVSISKTLHGVNLVITGDEVPAQENAVVVCNHQDMADITFLMVYARTKGRLGDMKYLVKDALKYVPGVGWGMLFLDCVFVKRDWAKDQKTIRRTFACLLRKAGVDMLTIKDLGRWESLEMVQRYTRSVNFLDCLEFYRAPLSEGPREN